LDDTKS